MEPASCRSRRTTLDDLPVELLMTFAQHLDSLKDFLSLAHTSRYLKDCLAHTLPNTLLRLAVGSAGHSDFSECFLLMANAPSWPAWARLSAPNEAELRRVLTLGSGVARRALVLDHCGLTMERLREALAMRRAASVELGEDCSVTRTFWI